MTAAPIESQLESEFIMNRAAIFFSLSLGAVLPAHSSPAAAGVLRRCSGSGRVACTAAVRFPAAPPPPSPPAPPASTETPTLTRTTVDDAGYRIPGTSHLLPMAAMLLHRKVSRTVSALCQRDDGAALRDSWVFAGCDVTCFVKGRAEFTE